jgi:DNA-directed RNA polymerase subunit omega
MLIPTEELFKLSENPFQVAIVAARRARQLNGGAQPLVSEKFAKNTTTALCEIKAGKITFKYNEKTPSEKNK